MIHTDRAIRQLFGGTVEFVAGANTRAALPKALLPEIAFLGRSNVGKSSLLNALLGRTHLARVSHTPGRTRQINFFQLGTQLMLVDLPGYGYAKASKAMIDDWQKLVHAYLRGRHTLERALVLIDVRVGIKPKDRDLFHYLDDLAVPYQVIITKIDKVGKNEQTEVVQSVQTLSLAHAAMHPEVIATSSRTGEGMTVLQSALAPHALGWNIE